MGALGDEDIEIVDAATQVKIAPKRIVRKRTPRRRTSRSRASDPPRSRGRGRRLLLEEQRPGPDVPAQDGERLAPDARGRGRDREAHRAGRARSSAPSSTRRSPSARSSISATSSVSTRSASRRSSATPKTTDAEFDEEEADRRILRLIDKVKHLDKVGQELKESPGVRRRPGRRASRPRSTRNRQKMVETLEEMRLNKKTIDKDRRQAARPDSEGRARGERHSTELAKRHRRRQGAAPQGGSHGQGDVHRAQVQAQVTASPDEVLGAIRRPRRT
jgi:RNA polymerase primary sigma factor